MLSFFSFGRFPSLKSPSVCLGGCGGSRLELDQRNGFGLETAVADPLGVHLARQQRVRLFVQSSAAPMEPKVATALAQDGFVGIVNLTTEGTMTD
jgi:hypothetical protein